MQLIISGLQNVLIRPFKSLSVCGRWSEEECQTGLGSGAEGKEKARCAAQVAGC